MFSSSSCLFEDAVARNGKYRSGDDGDGYKCCQNCFYCQHCNEVSKLQWSGLSPLWLSVLLPLCVLYAGVASVTNIVNKRRYHMLKNGQKQILANLETMARWWGGDNASKHLNCTLIMTVQNSRAVSHAHSIKTVYLYIVPFPSLLKFVISQKNVFQEICCK